MFEISFPIIEKEIFNLSDTNLTYKGYLEKEIHKVVDEYNGIAQVFQTFYGKDSEGVDDKGVNSYQLTYYKGRWWIVSLLWTMESKGKPIPAKYGGIK